MPIIEPEFMELTRALDVQAFWAENEQSQGLTTAKPRCPVSLSPDDHWLFEFLPVESALRYYHDKAYRDSLHCQANRIMRETVGKQFFDEDTWENSPRRIENLFGSEFAYHENSTPWLVPSTDDPHEFSAILDRVEKIDLATWAFPDEFLKEWELRKKAGKPLPLLGSGTRGPATVMTSILKPEIYFLWIYDHPALMQRFRDLLAVKMVELCQVLRQFSGNTQPGFWNNDDNCALFNRKLYREYCFPILQKAMNTLAPAHGSGTGNATRYQHSDSAMGHLLDMQYELGIREVNYGPEVDAGLIRQKMPDAVIHGQMPPFLLRNGSPEDIRRRIITDYQKAGGSGRMVMTTAGSLAAGTGIGRLRYFMLVVQADCRYN